MNENINLTKILKDCPRDWKLYSSIWGEVRFKNIIESKSPIIVELSDTSYQSFMTNGKFLDYPNSECCLFPSKDQRDWNKFTAPWYKKKKFDPKTLKPFDKVLVRKFSISDWWCGIFSHHQFHWGVVFNDIYKFCIPYNDDTKSPWINYKEEKPPFGVEVIAYHHKWVDEDFNPNGTRIGFLLDDGFTSAFWWDYQDCYETISKQHCESNKDFYANHIDNIEPEFWCPMPKFPKLPK